MQTFVKELVNLLVLSVKQFSGLNPIIEHLNHEQLSRLLMGKLDLEVDEVLKPAYRTLRHKLKDLSILTSFYIDKPEQYYILKVIFDSNLKLKDLVASNDENKLDNIKFKEEEHREFLLTCIADAADCGNETSMRLETLTSESQVSVSKKKSKGETLQEEKEEIKNIVPKRPKGECEIFGLNDFSRSFEAANWLLKPNEQESICQKKIIPAQEKGSLKHPFGEDLDFDPKKDISFNYLSKAKIAFFKGEFEIGVKYCNKAIELQPSFHAYFWRGSLLNALEKFEDSLCDVEKAIETCGNTEAKADGFSLKAINLIKLNRFQEAIEVLNEAIKHKPDDIEICGLMAKTLHKLNSYEEAIKYCNRVLQRDGRNAQIYMIKGNCLEKLEKFNEALLNYDQVIKYDHGSDSFLACTSKALILETQGKTAEIISCIEHALTVAVPVADQVTYEEQQKLAEVWGGSKNRMNLLDDCDACNESDVKNAILMLPEIPEEVCQLSESSLGEGTEIR